jgi:hypothetical protein
VEERLYSGHIGARLGVLETARCGRMRLRLCALPLRRCRFSHYHLTVADDVAYSKFMRAGRCGPLHSGRFVETILSPVLRPGCVDLGAVAVRTAILAMSGLRFFTAALAKDPKGTAPLTLHPGCANQAPAYCADGALFSKLAAAAKPGDLSLLRTPLYFHQ